MAGGKETPRQKMIGMMYLVLTALLALNVSKSILDAFVSIEENMQTSNLAQLYRGDEKKGELSEVATDNSNKQRAEKAKLLVLAVKDIDKMTSDRIKMIDDLKLLILKNIGEDIQSVGKETSVIMDLAKENGIKPIRMNLMQVNSKDKFDDPMRIMLGDNTDIKNPLGKGLELWKSINNYRLELTQKIASTQVVYGKNDVAKYDKRFDFITKNFNQFKNQDELNTFLRGEIESNTVHPDDVEDIIEVYSILTKNEFSNVNGTDNVHWLGKTFDHSPAVAAIASLTALQNDILAARSQAVTLIRNRVTGGEYSFNKVIPLAYGPVVANVGDDVTLKVMMAAYDSDKQPRVTVNREDADIKISEGQGVIKLKAGGNSISLSGTIAVQKKSGQWKEEKWAHEIVIMKPSGSIELPDMNTLYRGLDNKVQATASGYDKTELQGSGITKTKTTEGWNVTPQGRSNSASLQVVGINSATGERKVLKMITYKVRNLPKPSIFWGGADENSRVNPRAPRLFVKYPPEIPLNADFSIISWECDISGAPGRKPSGTGNNISSALPLIQTATRGTTVTFRCVVKYPGNRTGRVNASFKL
tara:strand:+ start:12298 stop:14061 length:1764 start_codon:yes stop_codon:yes gene_type:complete